MAAFVHTAKRKIMGFAVCYVFLVGIFCLASIDAQCKAKGKKKKKESGRKKRKKDRKERKESGRKKKKEKRNERES